ncbi:hypothetical protein WMY93_023204 [Mugilogobius chulae]|uniref:Uncharacterized protein n=1 Tax=Mugilogobius chulae TaxID=88201 RepID=A0AAW0N6P0_9GOBI
MSSHPVETLVEPVFGRRMPSYSQNVAPAGLSQPQSMPSFMGKPYSGAYFSFRPSGKDISAFPLVERQSPVTHISGPDRPHIYRKDSRSDESHPGYANSRPKQGFTLYTKSPVPCSPQNTASVIVRKGHGGADTVSTDRPVYLAVPQPVYRHSPCCSDLCCVMGHGSPSLPNRVYDHNRPSESPLHQRRGPTEPVAVFSPGRTRTLPAVVDQNYSPTKEKEVSHSLQCSPRAYPGLYPSQTAYEPVIYHNTSPISKYGQAVQHPFFYYPSASMEVDKRTESQHKGYMHKEDVSVVLKHTMQPPGDHYMAGASLHRDISLPRREAMPNPAFLPGFEYPGYIVPSLNVNTSPLHSHRLPRTVHSEFTNTSPKLVHRPVATLGNSYRDKPTQHTEHSFPSVHVEQTSPSTCIRKSVSTASSTQTQNRYGPPKSSLYVEPQGGPLHGALHPIHAPPHLGIDVRHSKHHAYHPLHYPKPLQTSPTRTVITSNSNPQKILYCPPLPAGTNRTPNLQSSYVHKGTLKRSLSSPIKIHDDDDDVFVVESDSTKRQKTEQDVKSSEISPPMPVINNVFSLAPYQAYLQMSKLLLRNRLQGHVPYSSDPRRSEQSHEHVKPPFAMFNVKEVRQETNHIKRLHECSEPVSFCRNDFPNVIVAKRDEKLGRTQQQTVLKDTETSPLKVKIKQECPDELPNTCASLSKSELSPAKPNADFKICKKESVDRTDQSSCSEISESPEQLHIIKKEPEEIELPDTLEIKKCEFTKDKNRSPEGTPTRSSPLQPDARVSFHNIPPQCLKLSTYNIILPEGHLMRSVQKPASEIQNTKSTETQRKSPEPEKTPPPPPVPYIPLQMPVRKHFFELHQSLVKLVSKSVAATSEDTLRAWLSKMELSHVASSKNQKVSCLFGSKGRNSCLNEEMMSSLHQVYQRLNEYSAQERCPFPFVMRTGDIFLPMLVVKEVLFPLVPGGLIDQALQEHRVELRPTTLSEEKALIQMHKRACSSRLRRLMSFKHLPGVYADVVNLLYYTCVCKQLESTSCDVQSSVQD